MKRIIKTDLAPKAIGPYQQAVIAQGLLFTSGQIALDPATGELRQGTLEEETHRVMRNLGGLLEAAGATFHDVVKCTVYVRDMHAYARINAVYAEYFDADQAPARELVEVSNLPRFVNIEISLIARISG